MVQYFVWKINIKKIIKYKTYFINRKAKKVQIGFKSFYNQIQKIN